MNRCRLVAINGVLWLAWLGHTKLETTATYLNLTAQYLHELNERKPLTLVKG